MGQLDRVFLFWSSLISTSTNQQVILRHHCCEAVAGGILICSLCLVPAYMSTLFAEAQVRQHHNHWAEWLPPNFHACTWLVYPPSLLCLTLIHLQRKQPGGYMSSVGPTASSLLLWGLPISCHWWSFIDLFTCNSHEPYFVYAYWRHHEYESVARSVVHDLKTRINECYDVTMNQVKKLRPSNTD